MIKLVVKFLTVFFAASYITLNLGVVGGKFNYLGLDPLEYYSYLWVIPTSIVVTYIGVHFFSLKKSIGISVTFLAVLYMVEIILSIYLVPTMINYVEHVSTWEYYKDQVLGAVEKMKPLAWIIGGIVGLIGSRVIQKLGYCKPSR
ncbi:hypothetical protein [Thermincola potens]|uniref:Uncharacterized protein n=1 Tax=Thermincola potens (strain JR) TaxID=635013 RepID=D5XBZ9_THEPJ|nr:hypothetical protein [Thermincola potens]ADG81547.1 hypothetical protein TherJR_0677 [Thermincola potens JR]